MLRTSLVTLLAMLMPGAGAIAQVIFPGSTVEGDYLRGVGVAAAGMGVYNYRTAEADAINTNTAIRWNEYVSAVTEYQSRRYAMRRARILGERSKAYSEILQRIKEKPDDHDVQNGDALNSVVKELLDPGFTESLFRSAKVPLSVDVIRRIPFKLDVENIVFSMHRLTARGKDKWPPALQDPQFSAERRAYEEALDKVLEQQIVGEMTIQAIQAVGVAVDDLSRKLDQVLGRRADKLYIEARDRLAECKKTAQLLLKSHRMELIVGQLETYSGTTVRDLLVFMQSNHLGFARAETPGEKGLYPELFAALVQQRELISGAPSKRER